MNTFRFRLQAGGLTCAAVLGATATGMVGREPSQRLLSTTVLAYLAIKPVAVLGGSSARGSGDSALGRALCVSTRSGIDVPPFGTRLPHRPVSSGLVLWQLT